MRTFYLSLLLFLSLVSVAFGQQAGLFIGGAWSGNVSPTSVTVAIRLTASGRTRVCFVAPEESVTVPEIRPTIL